MQSVADRIITQSICLNAEQITRLRAQARETGKSISQIAREAVDKFFQAQEVTQNE